MNIFFPYSSEFLKELEGKNLVKSLFQRLAKKVEEDKNACVRGILFHSKTSFKAFYFVRDSKREKIYGFC